MNNLRGPRVASVSHLRDNLQIIACAGAGKTEAVSQRVVAQLQMPGVKAENVVAFTFNERAAAELKDRIALRFQEQTGSRQGLADLYVGTIHGFCLDVLQANEPAALSFSVLSDIQQRLFIARNSSKSGLSDLGWLRHRNAGTYAEVMAILREGDIDERALAGTTIESCMNKYLDLLAQHRYLDFTAIVANTVHLLEDDPGFRGRVGHRVKFLTVDEYQDVNPIQERLIRCLHDHGTKVTVVGDDDQLLYSWRGSSIANILEFEARYPDVRTIRIERNFRSSPGVVDLARHVITRNDPDRLCKRMVSAERQAFEDGDLEIEDFADHTEEARHIAARIQMLLGVPFCDAPDSDARGLSYSDFAILVRVKKLIPAITEALDDADIPYVVAGVSSLFDTREAEAARQLFYYLSGRSRTTQLKAAWTAAGLGLSTADIARGLTKAKENLRRIEAGEGRFGIYNLQRSYLDFLEAIRLREETVASARDAHAAEVAFYNLGKFSQIISDFEQINFQSDPQRKYESFAAFLEHQAGDVYPEGWLEARYVTPDAVQILTIHQAKGLQWPAVFVPGLTKERFPPRGSFGRTAWHAIPDGVVRNRSDYRDKTEDERRLFYVAMTRAKKYLTITRAPYPSEKRVWHTPSPFWEEVLEAQKSLRIPDPLPRRQRLTPRPVKEMSDVSLSFSELKFAFECPYSFKLRFLYGFNAPIAEALGYGKGLHDCLYDLHDRAIHGGDTSIAVVADLVARHLWLPFAYRDLSKALSASARRRLREYIDKRSGEFADIEFAERPIELDLGDGIRVNGRIDLIRRRSTNEVVVIDFKSNDRTQQEDVTDLQLRVYALGYEQATGESAASVVVDNLDNLDNPRADAVTSAMLETAADSVRRTGARMRHNDYPRNPTGGSTAARRATCGRCDMNVICARGANGIRGK